MKFFQPNLKIISKRWRAKRSKIWLVKETKVDGKVEIGDPYLRRIKLVISKKLKPYRCDEGNKHTTRTNNEP